MQIKSECLSRWCMVACAVVTISVCQSSIASSGAILPLDQYQAGTESVNTTNVKNGGFEQVTTGNPDFWTAGNGGTVGGSMSVGAPVGPNSSPAVNGSFVAQGTNQSLTPRNGFTQQITFATLPVQSPSGNYQLSGYAWNFSPSDYDLIVVELRDSVNPSLSATWSLAAFDSLETYSSPPIDGARGVFGSKSFSAAVFTSGIAELQVSFELDAADTTTVRPALVAQMDNISITPSETFVPPRAIPEPAAISILALAGLGAMRRRRD